MRDEEIRTIKDRADAVPLGLAGETWRGTVTEHGEETVVAVVREDDNCWPMFHGLGSWREPAPRFGHRIMTAWALAREAERDDAERLASGLERDVAKLNAEGVALGLQVHAAERRAERAEQIAAAERALRKADDELHRAVAMDLDDRSVHEAVRVADLALRALGVDP